MQKFRTERMRARRNQLNNFCISVFLNFCISISTVFDGFRLILRLRFEQCQLLTIP